MTGRRRLRICVRGVVQGVGFRPFVYTTAAAAGLTGSVRNDSSGAIVEVEGDDRRRRGVPDQAAAPAATARGRSKRCRQQDIPLRGRHRVHHRGHLPIRRRTHPRLTRRRDVRRLRGRTARPGQPALPAPVRQLHQLRAPVHHHRLAALRPRRHDDGRASPCATTVPASTPTPPTAASTPNRCAAPTAGRRCATGRTTDGSPTARTGCGRPESCCATAAYSRSRASAAITWPATRPTSSPSPSCADASAAATSRSR